jgi:hypothetical protein
MTFLEPFYPDAVAHLGFGAVIDDRLRRRYRGPIARRPLAIRIELFRHRADHAGVDVRNQGVAKVLFDLIEESRLLVWVGLAVVLRRLPERQDCSWPIEMTVPVLLFDFGNVTRRRVFIVCLA